MRAEIISVGTELLLGEIVDTNSSFIASQLPLLGIDLYWISQVGDNPGRLEEILRRALSRSDLAITTGGLGPTADDLTREAIASVLGEQMEIAPHLEKEIKSFFTSRNLPMPPHNLKQAMLIPSASPLPNPQGTAPGWWIEKDGRLIVALPGPPVEMQPIWEREVVPRLRRKLSGEVIISRVIKTFGLSEAAVDEIVSPFFPSSNPTLGIYAKADGIYLRLASKAATKEEAQEMLAHREEQIRKVLGEHIWGTDQETLEGVVGSLLVQRGLTLATMEGSTGGLLASILTDAPGSSAYFKGGLVAYSDEAKIAFGVKKQLIADYGSVSPQVAEAMASAIRHSLKADIGIGTTGVAGPGGVEGKLVGTIYIAIDDGKQIRTRSTIYVPRRAEVKRRAVQAALFDLRKILLAQG